MCLQCAIEDNGYVDKTVGGQDISYRTNTSVILCSTPFDAADAILTKEGIFQRCVVSYNNRAHEIIKQTFRDSRLMVREETYIEKFKPYLELIKKALESSKKSPKQVTIPNELNIKITEELENIFEKERELVEGENDKGVFDSYFMRAGINADKMALNMMFIYGKHKIDMECYEIPMKIYKHHVESIRKMLNKHIPEATGNKKDWNKERASLIIKEHKGNRGELYKKIMKSENVGRNKAIDIIKECLAKSI